MRQGPRSRLQSPINPRTTRTIFMTRKILILGGTTEGRLLAERLAGDPRFDATLSLAGRTANPAPQALPMRVGGFGGIEGLAVLYTIRGH